MSPRSCATLILPLAALLAGVGSAHAGIVIVGSCKSGTHLPTIQQAVNASAPGGTVEICPGTYPEQVTITENLTLLGLSAANQAGPVVTAPAGGVLVNTTYLGTSFPVAAQILVQNASVKLSNLTIDGTGNAISGCSPDLVGILYQNASGTIQNDLVRNQFIAPYAQLGGCQSGQGIWVESTTTPGTVTIAANVVQAFQKNGITGNGPGLTVTMRANTLYGFGATSGAGQNGIQVSSGTKATLSANKVGDEIWAPDQFGDTGNAASGILVYDAPATLVSGNSVSSAQYGIVIYSDGLGSADGATITGNSVGRIYFYDAVDICGAGSASISHNTLDGADESGVHLDSSCGTPSTGNSVTSNSIDGSCAAVLQGAGSAGDLSGNQVFNSTAIDLTGTDSCAATSPSARRARLRPRAVTHP